MKLGASLSFDAHTDARVSFLKNLGVKYVMGPMFGQGGQTERLLVSKLRQDNPQCEDLIALKKWVESCELELCGITHSTPNDRWDQILLTQYLGLRGRDEQIENFRNLLRNMGKAEIPMVMYRWDTTVGAWLNNWRTTAETVGRGGAKLVSFDYEVAKKVPVSHFGQITEESIWDSLTYFLKAVVPVAEESGVNLVMHPADPQVPSIAGIARIIRSVEAYDRLFEIVPSNYSRMVFCLGCFSQMLDPEGVYDAIRHFGTMGKIGVVHFRNVKGSLERFDEVYPDEGKLDMFKAIELLKEVGYKNLIYPDHVPRGTGDTDGFIGNAFQIGYLKGVLQSASALD